MPLPKRSDVSLNWHRVKHQDPEFWSLTDEEMEIAKQSSEFSEDDIESPLLIEDLSDFGRMVHSAGVRQLNMMFDDIKYKHHPEGTDEYDNE